MATIKIVLKENKLDNQGLAPLYLRITVDRKSRFISLGIKLSDADWDKTKQRVKKSYQNSARINALISQKVAEATANIADIIRSDKFVSANKIKSLLKGGDVPNFFEFAYKHCSNIKGSVSYSTYKNYVQYLKKFEDWYGSDNLNFDQITVSLLKDYMSYMGNILKNGNTTQRYSIKILGIIFKEAISQDLVPDHMYPFSKLTLKKDPSKRLYLTEEQILQLKNLELNDKQSFARDLFLFATSAGGLRFSDIVELQYSHYNYTHNRITKVIRKTGRNHNFKIGSTALDILNKYYKSGCDHDDFIFPIVTNNKAFIKYADYRYKVITSANHSINFQLKSIGKKMNLPFSLSFHLSRHTYATTALNRGMRIEHVSKLMDHSDITVTQIYAKILNDELDKAVEQYIN